MRKLILPSALIVVGAGAFMASRHQGSPNMNSTPLARMTAATSSPREIAVGGGAKAGAAGASAPADSRATAAKPAEANKSPEGPAIAFEHQDELDQYRDLKKKVLGSDDDARERSRLKSDAVLLDSFRDLLKSAALTERTRENQNAALDLLFEALKDKNTQAEAILQGVIQDAQIESSALAPAVRENLAGIKAEALYQWSSIDPGKASALSSWLPGPVSQKIWQNIQDRQESNLAESKLEARR